MSKAGGQSLHAPGTKPGSTALAACERPTCAAVHTKKPGFSQKGAFGAKKPLPAGNSSVLELGQHASSQAAASHPLDSCC